MKIVRDGRHIEGLVGQTITRAVHGLTSSLDPIVVLFLSNGGQFVVQETGQAGSIDVKVYDSGGNPYG